MTKRRPWAPGDPVGCGEVFLPTRRDVLAYTDACQAAILDATARSILAEQDLATRRARIDAFPEAKRDALKARIKELWNERRK